MKKLLKIIFILFSTLALLGAIVVFGILLKFRMEIKDLQHLVEDYKPATMLFCQ